ncbi:probable serine/threonine-protein kinase PBL28 [Magnolia sinica]|uniref:probable serine/threonine-protein kinase PBL28 n=1 Tax=Magnolia sinica TaxID=86752 RepID=UPI00265AC09D|nr:probable serine/threonine-protein kinase PBL28 [Magnolia sinica]
MNVLDPACDLDFSKYPYEPSGECLHHREKIKEWGGVTTNRCCGNSLNTLSQALALHVNGTGTGLGPLFIDSNQWLACDSSDPNYNSISIKSCGFEHLYLGSSACSNLTLSYLVKNFNENYQALLKTCSQFDTPSFNDTCSRCAKGIEDTTKNLLMHLNVEHNSIEMEICPVAIVVAIAVSKIGNATWVNDFYRCLPALDRQDTRYFRIKYAVAKAILAITMAAVGLLLIIMLIKYVTRKNKPTKRAHGKGINAWSGLYRFSRVEIENAMNFGNQRESLGAGSAGRVYKGILPSGQVVAIKQIYKSKNSDSFTREVDGLSRIRHPNLVCLFGCCVDRGEQFLVYEYCAYGNLAQHLLRNDNVLSWDERVRILRDCALALRFLHGYPDGCIVHRDIKLTNILLTEDMTPKLSDFGLAKILGMQESKVFTDVRGTIGYMDPEYMINAKLTSASDVYSFGIVVLQILSGRRVIELDLDARDHLTRKAKDVFMKRRPLSDFVDPQLNGQLNMEDFEAILKVAVLCVAKSSKGRPTISVVFDELDKVWKNSVANMTARARSELSSSSSTH